MGSFGEYNDDLSAQKTNILGNNKQSVGGGKLLEPGSSLPLTTKSQG